MEPAASQARLFTLSLASQAGSVLIRFRVLFRLSTSDPRKHTKPHEQKLTYWLRVGSWIVCLASRPLN